MNAFKTTIAVIAISIMIALAIPVSAQWNKDQTIVSSPDSSNQIQHMLRSLSRKIESIKNSVSGINDELPFPYISIMNLIHEFVDNPMYYFKHGAAFFISLTVIEAIICFIIPILGWLAFVIGYPIIGLPLICLASLIFMAITVYRSVKRSRLWF